MRLRQGRQGLNGSNDFHISRIIEGYLIVKRFARSIDLIAYINKKYSLDR